VRRVVDPLLRPVGSVGSVLTSAAAVVLTFDDGPDPRWTPPLLDLLDEAGATATFFVLTERARRHRGIVQRIAAAGHEVALHGEDHTRLTTLPLRAAQRSIVTSHDELEQLVGLSVRWFRPPYGAQSLATYAAARADGLQVVVWGPAARDWEEGTPDEVAARAMVGLRPGSVVLLHDGLWLPPGQAPPTFDRTESIRVLLASMGDAGLAGSSLGRLLASGRPRPTAWFRP
jgi:peptidoglycan/xylan/chitin deacetylase (PgdA/CDA1 family)